jgi:hypothetical protein
MVYRRRRERPEDAVITREEGWRLYLEKLEVTIILRIS